MQKIKVFISYYHLEDQGFKETLSNHLAYDNELEDASVSLGDISDELTDEQIRQKIRDEYIKDSDVFVLLCGKNTRHRKHIDWEIHAAMYKSDVKKPLPIIVINVDENNNYMRVSDYDINKYFKDLYYRNSMNSAYSAYLYNQNERILPERILSSITKYKCPITVLPLKSVYSNWTRFGEFIESVYNNRTNFIYDDSSVLRRRNGENEWY